MLIDGQMDLGDFGFIHFIDWDQTRARKRYGTGHDDWRINKGYKMQKNSRADAEGKRAARLLCANEPWHPRGEALW